MTDSAETPPQKTERRAASVLDEGSSHILVVDDDTRIRTLLQRYLMDNGYRVTMAKDAAQARARLRGLEFDLVVLDVMMPGESGLELAQSLRQTSLIPILLLTARGDPMDRIAGLEAGADDYLPKPFEPRELLLRIDAIIRRAKPPVQTGPEIRLGQCRFNLEQGELFRDNELVRLTSAEQILMSLFARHPGETFSRADLCNRTNVGLERSIDVQITRLRRKIEPNPKEPVYLQTVRGVGYVLMVD